MSRWLAALPLIVLIALGGLFGLYALHRNPQVQPQALVGKSAPSLSLPTLAQGAPTSVPAVAASGPIIVNFFASWCAPCEIENPVLMTLKGEKIRVVGVAYKDAPTNTQAFLTRTVTGRAMQAVAQNASAATVLGIDVPRMVFYTFAVNAVLACAAALLIAPTYLAKFDMGESLGTKAFFAAVIGGFNNSRGALLGGILVGVCENLAAAYASAAYKDAVALAIFMIVILVKPRGLLGTPVERKV